MQQKKSQLTLTRIVRSSWVLICLLFLGACHLDMYDQAKFKANDVNPFFEDGRANRPPVPNTVAVGQYQADPAFLTGKDLEGNLVAELPVELTMDLVQRGQVQYDTYCAPCHGMTGAGDGLIAQRGGIVVPSLQQDRLRTVAIGYYFDVITNGINRMYSYAARITPQDRWAIAAYVRALQLSQNATLDDVPPEERAKLPAGGN